MDYDDETETTDVELPNGIIVDIIVRAGQPEHVMASRTVSGSFFSDSVAMSDLLINASGGQPEAALSRVVSKRMLPLPYVQHVIRELVGRCDPATDLRLLTIAAMSGDLTALRAVLAKNPQCCEPRNDQEDALSAAIQVGIRRQVATLHECCVDPPRV